MTAMMLQADGLARTFHTKKQTVEAVRGVDLNVDPGEIVGFLGPNGAGKTTTLRMLTTLLTPTAGAATVAGHDLLREPGAVRRRIGYVAQTGGVDPTIPAGEELADQGEFYGMPARTARARAAELAERFALTDLLPRPAITFSGGQRRRLDLALGLVHRPDLMFLDEPSTGLDPHSRAGLWDNIRQMRDADGLTVFCSTHYLDEADALCDRVLIIDDGRIVAEGAPAELKRKVSGDVVIAELPAGARDAAEPVLAALPGVRSVEVDDAGPDGAVLRLAVEDGHRALSGVVLALDDAGVRPRAVRVRRPSLDDVFAAVTGRRFDDA